MNTNLTEIIFILDRSGSMSGLEGKTIDGYNGFLQKQRLVAGDALITTVLFDNQYEMLHDGINIRLVRPITTAEYYTRGSTALLDAVGKTILDVGRRLSQTAEENRPGQVIFVITTDGMENSSREFSYAVISDMIRHQKEKYNWQFIFLAANIDADAMGDSLGITRDEIASFSADDEGTETLFECLEDVIEDMRSDKEFVVDLKKTMRDVQSRQGKKGKRNIN
jgi:hypothetical protein